MGVMRSETGVPSPAREFWDRQYSDENPSTPPPPPNAAFVALAGELALVPAPRRRAPRALELACGRGGDALWLAARGWRVTAVDVSAHVLDVLAERSRLAGVEEHLDLEAHDLASSAPDTGPVDLVYANYFHTTTGLARDEVLRASARSVRDEGILLVVDHGSSAPWSWNRHDDHPTADDLWRSLGLGPEWTAVVVEQRTRLAHGPEGRSATVVDNVVAARRQPGTTPQTERV
ncbi:SAM-dependent methyltransferase [Nocardiopsis sp. L17-MgMaSL7]|nr:SAM-dependent methyltransferase [Nocardiopsis sp. L17-MgMaSL7]